jgi:hypothetical protein
MHFLTLKNNNQVLNELKTSFHPWAVHLDISHQKRVTFYERS